MTPRYRCLICGSITGRRFVVLRHMLVQHKAAVLEELSIIEGFGTRKPFDPPRNGLKGHPPLNPGVSGEGDSS